MAKGKNKNVTYVNHKFKKIKGNQTEIDFYKNCESAKLHGAIKEFDYQFKMELVKGITDNCGKVRPSTKHTLDFVIESNTGEIYIIDTKGTGGMKSHTPTSILKRRIYMAKYERRYFMISKLPKYLGGHWVDSTPNYDLLNAIKKLYKELYPWANTRKKDAPTLSIAEINKYYEIKAVDKLFYTSNMKLKQQPKARPNPQMEMKI